jgi:hypothetical protein
MGLEGSRMYRDDPTILGSSEGSIIGVSMLPSLEEKCPSTTVKNCGKRVIFHG